MKSNNKKKSPSHLSAALVPMPAFAALPTATDQRRLTQEDNRDLSKSFLASSLSTQVFGIPTPPPELEDSDRDSLSVLTNNDNESVSRRKVEREQVSIVHKKPKKTPRQQKGNDLEVSVNENPEEVVVVAKSKASQAARGGNRGQMQRAIKLNSATQEEINTLDDVDGDKFLASRKQPDESGFEFDEGISTMSTSALFNASKGGSKMPQTNDENTSYGDESVISRLRDEVASQRRVIHTLNVEMSHLPKSNNNNENIPSILPQRGPIPQWLVNTQYLVPLISIYEEKLRLKDDILREHQANLNEFERKMREIILENERLHLKLEENSISKVPANKSQSQLLIGQAKLVLQENQLLLEQLDVQQEKAKRSHEEYITEITVMKKTISLLETEKVTLQNEILRYPTPRSPQFKHSDANQLQGSFTDSDFFKTSMEEKLEKVLLKLEETQKQLKVKQDEVSDLTAEKSCLSREIKGFKHSLKEMHNKNSLLRSLVKEEQAKKDYMLDVVKLAHSLAEERDALANALRGKEITHFQSQINNEFTDKTQIKTIMNINDMSVDHEGHVKTIVKLKQLTDKLQAENDELKTKSGSLEREIVYLRAMVNDKDIALTLAKDEHVKMESRLETVWRAALTEKAS